MGVEGESGQAAQGLLPGGLKKRTSLACTAGLRGGPGRRTNRACRSSPIDVELSDPTQCADGFDRPDARG